MKTSFLFSIVCFLFISCNPSSNDLTTVEAFIQTLKENKKENIATPDFDKNDIQELLKYRNEDADISNFTRNPLSSFYMEDVKVGMYVLWTIETIRLKEIDDPNFYQYASLNPRLAKRSTGQLVDQENILPEVANTYALWWNSNLTLDEKLQVNPLDKMDLIWD